MTTSWTYTPSSDTPPILVTPTHKPISTDITTSIPTSQSDPTLTPNSDPSPQSTTPHPSTIPCHTQRQSTRHKHPPLHLKDYICSSITDHPHQQSSGSLYPFSNYISFSK
jgi:hypothetical protein